jgi:hypothetical protein
MRVCDCDALASMLGHRVAGHGGLCPGLCVRVSVWIVEACVRVRGAHAGVCVVLSMHTLVCVCVCRSGLCVPR